MSAAKAVTQSPQGQHLVGRTPIGPHQTQEVVAQLDSFCLSTKTLIDHRVAHCQPQNVQHRKHNVWSPERRKESLVNNTMSFKDLLSVSEQVLLLPSGQWEAFHSRLTC